jgi:nucleoside-diphosphate-sugar epimerase
MGQGDRGSRGGAAISQRVRPGDATRYAVRRGGVVLPLRPGGWPGAAVFEDGAQHRDFIHVRDVAAATVAALAAVAGPGVIGGPGALRAYNVGSGTSRTVGDMASALADAYGGPGPVV